MRIIAGEFRSRKLLSPPEGSVTRPLPDRVKESIFSLLRGHCEGAQVFDAFAGTGAFGLEAVSRGAARCVFIERDRDVADLLRRNVATLGAGDRCEVAVGDALGPGALARCPRPATIIFLDPPYNLVEDPGGWRRVRTQLERLIDCLGDTGFALVRTPWPFSHRPHHPASAEDDESGPRPHRAPASLDLAGAAGPETHVYGSTAVHLYMRRR